MADSIKACLDCVHCTGGDIFIYCHHPDYSYETKDYIHGHVYEKSRLCVLARYDEKLCGDDGRGWEEKPAKDPEYHRNLWSAFKGLLKEFF